MGHILFSFVFHLHVCTLIGCAMDKATWTTLAIGAGIMGAAAALRYYWNTTSSQSSVAASTTETTSSSSTSKSCSGGDDRSIQTNADLSSSLSAPRKCQESSDRAKAEVNEAKVIYFVRHGESLYNEHYERTGKDNMVWDAGLTAKGQQQARAAGETLRACGDTLDLCISSPLTRAINTCLLAVPPDSWHPKRYMRCQAYALTSYLLNSWYSINFSISFQDIWPGQNQGRCWKLVVILALLWRT